MSVFVFHRKLLIVKSPDMMRVSVVPKEDIEKTPEHNSNRKDTDRQKRDVVKTKVGGKKGDENDGGDLDKVSSTTQPSASSAPTVKVTESTDNVSSVAVTTSNQSTETVELAGKVVILSLLSISY